MNGRFIYALLMVVLLSATMPAFAQTGGVNAGFTPGSIFNADSYRPIQHDQHYKRLFLRDSTYVFEVLTTDSTENWLLKERALHYYDNEGNENVLVRSLLKDDGWVPTERLEFNYRSNDDLEKIISSSWSSEKQIWVKQKQQTYGYTYSGKEREVLTELWTEDRWTVASLAEKIYDEEEQLQQEVFSRWSNIELEWIPEERYVYAYNDSVDQPASEKFQIWDDNLGIWLNERVKNFVFDAQQNIIESVESTWSSELNDFVPAIQTEWAYNSDGQEEGVYSKPFEGGDSAHVISPVQNASIFGSSATYNEDGNLNQLVLQEWDNESEAWQPVRYEKHYWSEYITGNDNITEPDISCIYANPHTIGLPWFCESLKRDVQYTVELFDLTGRLYYADAFIGGNTFRIKRNIPSGIYIALITGGLDRHTEKVIIR